MQGTWELEAPNQRVALSLLRMRAAQVDAHARLNERPGLTCAQGRHRRGEQTAQPTDKGRCGLGGRSRQPSHQPGRERAAQQDWQEPRLRRPGEPPAGGARTLESTVGPGCGRGALALRA